MSSASILYDLFYLVLSWSALLPQNLLVSPLRILRFYHHLQYWQLSQSWQSVHLPRPSYPFSIIIITETSHADGAPRSRESGGPASPASLLYSLARSWTMSLCTNSEAAHRVTAPKWSVRLPTFITLVCEEIQLWLSRSGSPVMSVKQKS